MAEAVVQRAGQELKQNSRRSEIGLQVEVIDIFSECLPLILPIHVASASLIGSMCVGLGIAGFHPHHSQCPVAVVESCSQGCLIEFLTGLNRELGQFILKIPNCASSFSFPLLLLHQLPAAFLMFHYLHSAHGQSFFFFLPLWALCHLLWSSSSIGGSELHFFSKPAFSLSVECEIHKEQVQMKDEFL